MRIAMISEHASPLAGLGGADAGGQNVYVGHLARQLARRGWRVDVFTRRADPHTPEVVPLADGVRVVQVAAGPAEAVPKERLLPFMGEFARVFRGYARRERYRLCHAHFFMSAQVAADSRRRLGLPFVVTFHALGKVRRLHQGAADGFPPEREAIEARTARLADAVVAECPQDAADLVSLYGADPDRLYTVPCGFDPAEFSPLDQATARQAVGVPADEPVVLQLGRMVPRKGVDTVIRAVALLRQRHGVTARLLVVGGESREPCPVRTPELGRLVRVADECGAADRVTFVGSRGRAELRAFYCAADVFVTTPWYEPFGITPIEAMACGTAVVGAAVGGIKATVLDSDTGFLVPPKDPVAVADRLARLFADPALRRAMGERGRQRAVSRYTWAGVAEQIAGVYTRVLAAAAPPPAFAPAPWAAPAASGS